MKKIFFITALFAAHFLSAQNNIGIGTTTPNSKAILDISSTSRGILLPRMTTEQRTSIFAPPDGLMVYDTDISQFYHYDGSTWRKMLNSSYWSQSTTRNRIYNLGDSIGIGTSAPAERLDVTGNIRGRANVYVDGIVNAEGTVAGGALLSNGNMVVVGTSLLNDAVSVNSNITMNTTGATFQLKDGGVSKGFFQLAGDNVRFGTNSGNAGGDVTLRMDGSNLINFEKTANGVIQRFYNSAGTSNGVLQTVTSGNRFTITNPETNGSIEIGSELYIYGTANRIGVGTTSPQAKLDVNGDFRVSGDAKIYGDLKYVDSLLVYGNAHMYYIASRGGEVVNPAIFAIGPGSYAGGFASGAIGENVRVQGGDNSYIIGSNIRNGGDGTVVIADNYVPSGGFTSVTTDRYMFMRFLNGYRFITETGSGVELLRGDNSWSSLSDSTKKENFRPVNGEDLLRKISGMKLGSWNYKLQDKTQHRHYGPMAQEFHRNFGYDGVGKVGNDTTIATADIDGVMMIGLQALEKRSAAQQDTINMLSKEMEELKAIIAEQKKLLSEFINPKNNDLK